MQNSNLWRTTMKTHILSVAVALAVAILGPQAETRLLAQEPKNRVNLENVNLTGGNNSNANYHGARSVAFSPDGKTLAAAYTDLDGTIRLWDVASGKNTATFKAGESRETLFSAVAFSPDGKT